VTDKPSFKTRARVLCQLGEQLIKSEAIALLELIKNSYDADAPKCRVTMMHPNIPSKAKVIVRDNGEGMDYNTLSTVFLEIGTSYKADLSKSSDPDIKRSPKFKRPRLGEKGIGRLGVHRLGKEIEVITRKKDGMESVLRINWDDIEKSKYIEDLPVEIFERTPEVFTKGSGTKIIIKRFRNPWTRAMARNCARTITSLNSPFESNDSFRVEFRIPELSWLDGILTYEDIEQYKLFAFDITISGNQLTKFKYGFLPWPTMNKLKGRELTIADDEVKTLTKMIYKSGRDYEDINLGKFQVGEVRFKGVIFDRDSHTLALSDGPSDKMGFKKYLNNNGGIRVFRDNMRVLDYGELGNDWLDLGGRRVNMPTKRVSNNIILGAVYLDREKSPSLTEQANREGFVQNDAYWELWRAIRFAIDRVESLRKTDKDMLRKHYGPKDMSEPVVTSITELKDIVNHSVKDEKSRVKIFRYLDRIEKEYDDITDSLIKSAGAGLNLTIVIHQIEKIIKEIKSMLKGEVSAEVLDDRVQVLSSLVEGYSILVKKSDKKLQTLSETVEQCIFNMTFRLEAHQIELNEAYASKDDLKAYCSENHVLNALMNLIDNSIWWLGYSNTKNPKIFVDISDAYPGHVSVVVADNGPGFTKPTEQIIKPFVSDKPGGMGIGLHLTKEIMLSLGGKLLFLGMEHFDIPEEFSKGAVIALAFKKEGK